MYCAMLIWARIVFTRSAAGLLAACLRLLLDRKLVTHPAHERFVVLFQTRFKKTFFKKTFKKKTFFLTRFVKNIF